MQDMSLVLYGLLLALMLFAISDERLHPLVRVLAGALGLLALAWITFTPVVLTLPAWARILLEVAALLLLAGASASGIRSALRSKSPEAAD